MDSTVHWFFSRIDLVSHFDLVPVGRVYVHTQDDGLFWTCRAYNFNSTFLLTSS